MYSTMEISDRLKQARVDAGYRSAAEAASANGWVTSTYSAHENGTRTPKPADFEKYARAFKADPCEIVFNQTVAKPRVAGVSQRVLREVVVFVMNHEGAKTAPPEETADLILDLCNHVSQAGNTGLADIVDFQMRRHALRGR